MSNPINTLFNAGAKAVEGAAKQVEKTANDIAEGAAKSLDEYTSGMDKEMNDVGEAAKKGDFLGAGLEAIELFSPGAGMTEALSATGFLPDDPFVKNVASAAINFTVGGGLLNPATWKDMGDAAAALSAGGSSTSNVQPAESQTCERPSSAAAKRAKNRAKGNARSGKRAEAKDAQRAELREKAELRGELSALKRAIERLEEKVGDGYSSSASAAGGSPAEQLENVMKEIQSIISQLKGDPSGVEGRFEQNSDWLKEMGGDPNSEVAKLGPNATFEDFVAAFMFDIAREKQQQIKEMGLEMKQLNAEKQAFKALDKMEKAGQKIQSAALTFFGGPLGGLASAVSEMGAGGAEGQVEKIEDSRQLLFEKLKNEMNKLQEMMQALSNVLNTMHEGAMNAIRNIK